MVQQEQIDNLALLWEKAASRHADKPYIGTRNPSGTYAWYHLEVDTDPQSPGGHSKIGVGRGYAVGSSANNRLEWVIPAFATFWPRRPLT